MIQLFILLIMVIQLTTCIRIYFDTPSYDTMNSVGSDSILLNDISGYISNKHSNGEISGYTLMLDCSNLSFLE